MAEFEHQAFIFTSSALHFFSPISAHSPIFNFLFFFFTMKFSTAVSLFAGLVAALPAVELAPAEVLDARQLGGNTRNDLQNGGACPPVIFIFARGSTESGNLVSLCGSSVVLHTD